MLNYNRNQAVEYAHKWAYGRNPQYYNFDNIGGDCTNFISQCIFAGTGVMNYHPTNGWYYQNINNRAPAWTSVEYIYNFLTNNANAGPYGREVEMSEVEIGDLVQIATNQPDFHHTPIITAVGPQPSLKNILVAAHSYNADNRALDTYDIKKIRFIHVEGFNDF